MCKNSRISITRGLTRETGMIRSENNYCASRIITRSSHNGRRKEEGDEQRRQMGFHRSIVARKEGQIEIRIASMENMGKGRRVGYYLRVFLPFFPDRY